MQSLTYDSLRDKVRESSWEGSETGRSSNVRLIPSKKMSGSKTYNAIYLSPHLDDVALSCGGQIFQRTAAGEQILIVSIAAGDPPDLAVSSYAQSLHDRWELITDATEARRAEDIDACRILGAEWMHWDLPDCIYRYHPETGEPLYVSDPDIFGEVHAAEMPVVEQLRTQLNALPSHGEMVVPLTLGNHVDHQLTRLAAEVAFGHKALLFYEDYPYAQIPGARQQVIPDGTSEWQETIVELNEEALATKIKAISAYQSQLSTFFRDEADLVNQIRTFAKSVGDPGTTGGERLWRYTEDYA